MELLGALLGPSLKNKKNSPQKKVLIFQEMGLSSSNIKKLLTFTYISGNQNPEKKSLYFRKQKP